MTTFVVAGRVVDARTGRRVTPGEVELRQPDENEPVVTAEVDDGGLFHFELSDEQLAERLHGEAPNLHVQVSQGGETLPAANGPVRWRPSSEQTFLEVPVRVPAEKPSTEEILIESYASLLDRQDEIVERINRTPNGGQRFMVEPFRLLADVGVTVTPAARDDIVRVHPGLSGVSKTPYEALKGSRERQRLRYRIRRLDQTERRNG
jgi:hypothetical protein